MIANIINQFFLPTIGTANSSVSAITIVIAFLFTLIVVRSLFRIGG